MLAFTKSVTLVLVAQDPTNLEGWLEYFGKIAGDGFTAVKSVGGWKCADGDVVTEPVIQFTVWGASDSLLCELAEALDYLREREAQEAVSITAQGSFGFRGLVCFDRADIESAVALISQLG